jgi:hypothetical protein
MMQLFSKWRPLKLIIRGYVQSLLRSRIVASPIGVERSAQVCDRTGLTVELFLSLRELMVRLRTAVFPLASLTRVQTPR